VLITFSGLDGSGKSSLIAWLRTELERRHRTVAVVHMNDHVGVYAYLRAARTLGQRLLGRPVAPPPPPGVPDLRTTRQPRDEQGQPRMRGLARIRYAIIWNKPVRRILYLVDVAIFLGYRLYAERLRKRVLIMDRYFYDTLVDVADGRGWTWAKLLKRLTPTPDVPVLLDVTPEESFARKGEYSIEYLRRRWTGYQTVFPWVRSSVIVANHDINHTKRILERAVLERLAS
jgi:thymidylate kinase